MLLCTIIFIAGVAFVITIIYVFLKVGGLGGLGWRSRGIYVRASRSLIPHARRKCQKLIKKKGGTTGSSRYEFNRKLDFVLL